MLLPLFGVDAIDRISQIRVKVERFLGGSDVATTGKRLIKRCLQTPFLRGSYALNHIDNILNNKN